MYFRAKIAIFTQKTAQFGKISPKKNRISSVYSIFHPITLAPSCISRSNSANTPHHHRANLLHLLQLLQGIFNSASRGARYIYIYARYIYNKLSYYVRIICSKFSYIEYFLRRKPADVLHPLDDTSLPPGKCESAAGQAWKHAVTNVTNVTNCHYGALSIGGIFLFLEKQKSEKYARVPEKMRNFAPNFSFAEKLCIIEHIAEKK